jgi:hypothetical protein
MAEGVTDKKKPLFYRSDPLPPSSPWNLGCVYIQILAAMETRKKDRSKQEDYIQRKRGYSRSSLGSTNIKLPVPSKEKASIGHTSK